MPCAGGATASRLQLDNHAITIAQKNWPETHQLGDVRDVREVKKMDGLLLLIGGSPCQVCGWGVC